MTTATRSAADPLDLLGVGIGPFNLSLAAMSDRVPDLRTAFFEREKIFRWHPGLLIEDTTLQVPFLADLVSLVDPSSPWSFLSYLRAVERLYPFYFSERFHISRVEYDAYCRWVSESLAHCHFGYQVNSVTWEDEREVFAIDYTCTDAAGTEVAAGRRWARNVVLAIGTEPSVPAALRHLVEGGEGGDCVAIHSADYLTHRESLLSLPNVTVVGSGQSGAEIFLDLLRARPQGHEGLRWISRSPAFSPMEYSKLGLEQFTPDYTRFFRGLTSRTRDELLPKQWQLYKAISAETIGKIHDELYRRTAGGGWPDALLCPATTVRGGRARNGRIDLEIEHIQQGSSLTLTTDAVVFATGYTDRSLDALLHGVAGDLVRDQSGRPLVDAENRLVLAHSIRGSVFVQNAERHTHGVGSPDLGLAAWRSAVILNAVTGREVYSLPTRTAFTTFGMEQVPEQGHPAPENVISSTALR
jgi:putrescine N-hydroxylase